MDRKRKRPLALSEKNLEKFNAENEISGSGVNSLKRNSSRHSRKSNISQDTSRTQGASVASASYRYNSLADAQVFLHVNPPDYIDATITAIINADVTDGERAKLKHVASQFHTSTMELIRASVGKDDFLEILTDAFKALNKTHLCHRAKSDWREELKPTTRRRHFDLDFLATSDLEINGQHSEPDEALPPPLKRQQRSADQMFISPSSNIDTSDCGNQSPQETRSVPPPATPSLALKEGDRSVIKTPRPDLSIGILRSTLVSRLSTDAFSEVNVEHLLSDLQDQLQSREVGKPPEPILISVPSLRASDLAFPFLVVEGKAYSTGEQMFEAENQAAVSGACGLKIQLCLDDLVQKVDRTTTTSSDLSLTPSTTTTTTTPPPLFFSVCTEGPIHALWAHYISIENGVRKFKMTMLSCCNAAKLKDIEEFLVAFSNVCSWGMGGFLDSVVARLEKVVEAANLTAAR